MKRSFAERLAGGDPRSLGETNAVVREVLAQPSLTGELVACLGAPDERVRSRAANAIKKIAAAQPACLQPCAKDILQHALGSDPLIVQWNLTLVLGRLGLKGDQRALAVDFLFENLRSESSLQRTFCMQALADLALDDARLQTRLVPLFEELTASGTAAMRARGRKLLQRFKNRSVNRRSGKWEKRKRASKP